MKPLIPQIDKANHVILGMLIYCASACFLHPALAIAIVAGAAFTKEFWDYLDYGLFDFYDFLYTVGGAIPALILTLVKW